MAIATGADPRGPQTKGALALADVLCPAGRPEEAVPQFEDAIRFSEQKGGSVTAVKARTLLDRALSYA